MTTKTEEIVRTVNAYLPVFTIVARATENVLKQRKLPINTDTLDTIVINKILTIAKNKQDERNV